MIAGSSGRIDTKTAHDHGFRREVEAPGTVRGGLAVSLRVGRENTWRAGERVRVALTPLSDAGERIIAAVTADLDPGGAEVVTDRGREAGRSYYRDLCFKVHVHRDGEPLEIGDGGFTDWTARLLANQKERLLISGLSADRLAATRPPAGRG